MNGGVKGFVMGLAGSLLIAAFLMFLGGFLSFVSMISDAPPQSPKADAIVVLTGGDDRLAAGMELLSSGHGTRLLISGVNEDTKRDDIRGLIATAHISRFDCCVDLDKSALNTIGNAIETGQWARSNKYNSIIVVTANYHMPRALAELARAEPNLELIAYPVEQSDVHVSDWWRWPGSARLLVSEYMKYLATQMRFRVERF